MDEEKLLELAEAFDEDPSDEDARRELVEAMRSVDFGKMKQFRAKLADILEKMTGDTDTEDED